MSIFCRHNYERIYVMNVYRINDSDKKKPEHTFYMLRCSMCGRDKLQATKGENKWK